MSVQSPLCGVPQGGHGAPRRFVIAPAVAVHAKDPTKPTGMMSAQK